MPSALIVDDALEFQATLAALLRAAGYDVATARSLAEARAVLAARSPTVVLAALTLPDGPGIELLSAAPGPGAPAFIVIAGHAAVGDAITALGRGAFDYVTTPIDLPRWHATLANLARWRDLCEEIDRVRRSQPADGAAIVPVAIGTSIADAEQRLILATLDACGGDKARAAKILGISLKTLYNRLNRYKSIPTSAA
ncbi:MAG: response regulator [Deltaproteobacteria bacterium]|nr:response regulator [Deltaproteobacteria bacterium]